MRFVGVAVQLLLIFLHPPKITPLNCDKEFTYYEAFGQNGFGVTCNDITKGYEHILEKITIENEVSLTINNSTLEKLTANIFKNVDNIKSLSILNSTFEFDEKLAIFGQLKKLEALVIKNTRFEVNKDTLKGLTSLKSLELTNTSVGGIEKGGFKDLSALEKLELVDNHIKSLEDLQLCELKKLKTLNLRQNLLSDLKLFYFFCHRNQKSLDFNINSDAFLPNIYQSSFFNVTDISYDLIEIDLSYNQIIDLGHSLEGLTKLKYLNLGFNKLSSIRYSYLKNAHKVERMVLKNNQIQKLEARVFENKTKLVNLDLSYNIISEFSIADLPKLQYLHLGNNKLEAVSFRNLSALLVLDLMHNMLSNVSSEVFQKITRLGSLNLSGNKVVLQEKSFKNIPTLKMLILNNNSLNDLPENVFKGLKNLRILDLSLNQLATLPGKVFADLEDLEKLDLSENSLDSLPFSVLHPLKSLRSLDIAGNKLQFFEYDVIISKLPSLSNINIKSNLLTCDILLKIISFLKLKRIVYTSSENLDDLDKLNQNVGGIPCKPANTSLLIAVESHSTGSYALFNVGVVFVILLVAIVTGIVTYKFYIYLKRRKYRADEFELVDE